jgi:hypothetical protein
MSATRVIQPGGSRKARTPIRSQSTSRLAGTNTLNLKADRSLYPGGLNASFDQSHHSRLTGKLRSQTSFHRIRLTLRGARSSVGSERWRKWRAGRIRRGSPSRFQGLRGFLPLYDTSRMFAFGKVNAATGPAATARNRSDMSHLLQSPTVCQCASSGQQFAGWTVVFVVKFSFCERPGGQAGDSRQGEDLHD